MQHHSNAKYDAASAITVGARDHQEDAVVADFPVGSDTGFIVLSDGMGGHAAGDIASKIVMTEVFCELKFQSGVPHAFEENAPALLLNALNGANECLAAHISENPQAKGMGATLIAAVMRGNRLHWASVGDSPLYLFRGGVLQQLNEDHSMGPQIDLMADSGLIDSEAAKDHPDRNALLSVLCGDEIERIDCPDEGVELENNDIVIAASDGLQFIPEDRIGQILAGNRTAPTAEIARLLLDEIARIDDPDQDNTSIAAIRVSLDEVQDEVSDAVRLAFDFAAAMPEDDPEVTSEEAEPPVEEDRDTAAGQELGEAREDAVETLSEDPEPEPEPEFEEDVDENNGHMHLSEDVEDESQDGELTDAPDAAPSDAEDGRSASTEGTVHPLRVTVKRPVSPSSVVEEAIR